MHRGFYSLVCHRRCISRPVAVNNRVKVTTAAMSDQIVDHALIMIDYQLPGDHSRSTVTHNLALNITKITESLERFRMLFNWIWVGVRLRKEITEEPENKGTIEG